MPAGISYGEGVFHSDSYFINPRSGFISLQKALAKASAFCWRRWRDSKCSSKTQSPRSLGALRDSPCFFTSQPCLFLPQAAAWLFAPRLRRSSSSFIFKKTRSNSFCRCSVFGGDGETRTLAPVTRPTPLAGAPRHHLEYISLVIK